ncbi:MAG: ATP phosphoribosyltransferase regulatory subunit [Desulfuromonadales bacterium]|nr:ATP phosphoribosyltransferase regulatory subunit [Desulfuromonadales bacterium]
MRFVDSAPEAALPKGVKDFLPLKAAKGEYLQQQLRKVFSAWGFRPIVPPQLEFLDELEKGLGDELRELTFRFDDRQSGRLVAFPPDITPQVARIVATRMREMPLPLRLSYAGRVLRHAEQQAGKDRDIFQTGVELIGLAGPEADAEMIAMAVECLSAVGGTEFSVDIGQVDFFRGVMDGLPLTGELAGKVAGAIARKDSSELVKLLELVSLSDQSREEILALPRLFGGRDVLDRAERVVRNDRSRKALENLSRVLDVLEVYGVLDHVTLDLGELRGLNYHTGITFQGFLSGIGRAVCSGGRYDNLTGQYGFPAPATGFTFDLLNLLFALDRSFDERVKLGTDVLIFAAGRDLRPAQKLARGLRQRGFSVARDIIDRPLEAALDYARKTDFKILLAVAGEADNVRIIRTSDGAEQSSSYRELLSESFTLKLPV